MNPCISKATSKLKRNIYIVLSVMIGLSACAKKSTETIDDIVTVTPPVPPAVASPILALSQDVSSPSNEAIPVFTATGLEVGGNLQLYSSEDCSGSPQEEGIASAEMDITLSSALSDEGNHSFSAKQTNEAGESSDCSNSVSYTLDTVAPGTLNFLEALQPISSTNPRPTFEIVGLEENTTIQLYSDAACSAEIAISDNGINVSLSEDLVDDGDYSFHLTQTDQAGNSSDCSSGLSYTLDRVSETLVLALSSDTPSASGNPAPIFTSANLENEAKITFYSDADCSTSLNNNVPPAIANNQAVTLYPAFSSNQTSTIYAKQTDKTGNESPTCSNGISYEFSNDAFESVWRVGAEEYGDGGLTVTLPLVEDDGAEVANDYSYNFTVDWGDGSDTQAVTAYSADITHTYGSAGDYTIKITGSSLEAWKFGTHTDKNKIIEVKNFGNLDWKNLDFAFAGCSKLSKFTVGNADTDSVTSTNLMFFGAAGLTSIDLFGFNTSSVINMKFMFLGLPLSSIDLSSWDTSNVTDMGSMFGGSKLTSIDLSNWNTSNVTNMGGMFADSKLTSIDLSSWDTTGLENASSMFVNNEQLTTVNLSGWETDSLTTAKNMFKNVIRLDTLDVSSWGDIAGDLANESLFEATNQPFTLVCTNIDGTFFEKSCNATP